MSNGNLRVAGDKMVPAVRATVDALDPPAEDTAMVTLAFSLARSIDGMSPAVRDAMIAQVSGQLMRVLKELDERHRRRQQKTAGGQRNWLQEQRAARGAASRRS